MENFEFTVYYFASVKDLLKKKKDTIYIKPLIDKTSNIFYVNYELIYNSIVNTNIDNLDSNDLNLLKDLLNSSLLALYDEYLLDKYLITNVKNKDEFSVIPPVSGG